jgi:hypothetical protein
MQPPSCRTAVVRDESNVTQDEGVLARSGEQIVTPLFLAILSYSLLRLAQEVAKRESGEQVVRM